MAELHGPESPVDTEDRRRHWDDRHRRLGPLPAAGASRLALFADLEDLFPTSGTALDLACGRGRGAVWLASRGLSVHGVDISPVAVELATDYARRCGFASRCSFQVHDLNGGLPPGGEVDLVLCYLFRDPDLDREMVERLKPGGFLAVACLSEVGHGHGRFRAKPGELAAAFADLELLEVGEADGYAWLIGRRRAHADADT